MIRKRQLREQRDAYMRERNDLVNKLNVKRLEIASLHRRNDRLSALVDEYARDLEELRGKVSDEGLSLWCLERSQTGQECELRAGHTGYHSSHHGGVFSGWA